MGMQGRAGEEEEGAELGWAGAGHALGAMWEGRFGSGVPWTLLVWLLQVATHSPSELHSPEQRSFRERQKYFEIEVKQQQMDKPPKRVSLVGEDDLKKMKEEEGMLESVQGNLAC